MLNQSENGNYNPNLVWSNQIRKMFSFVPQENLGDPKPNLECNYTFPIDLAPIGIPIGAKSIG